MGVIHVGLVHCDPCECKIKNFHTVSFIERNISKRRHLQGVQQSVYNLRSLSATSPFILPLMAGRAACLPFLSALPMKGLGGSEQYSKRSSLMITFFI